MPVEHSPVLLHWRFTQQESGKRQEPPESSKPPGLSKDPVVGEHDKRRGDDGGEDIGKVGKGLTEVRSVVCDEVTDVNMQNAVPRER